jgi:hypothetical protein
MDEVASGTVPRSLAPSGEARIHPLLMQGIIDEAAPLPHERFGGSGFGLVLVLILVSLAFQLGAPDSEWARLLTLALQTLTLLAAFRVSGVHGWIIRVAVILAAVSTFSAAGVLIGSGELGELTSRSVGLMLVVLAPVAILTGLVRHFRAVGAVTLTTMFGALCVYLLAGMAFAFAYGVIAEIESAPFFADQTPVTQSDLLYFSFTTMTTTGYGDLTSASDVGRSFAITEELFGQVYLVTVVALIVGNLGRAREAGTA